MSSVDFALLFGTSAKKGPYGPTGRAIGKRVTPSFVFLWLLPPVAEVVLHHLTLACPPPRARPSLLLRSPVLLHDLASAPAALTTEPAPDQ